MEKIDLTYMEMQHAKFVEQTILTIARYFHKELVPFLIRHNMHFVAGNGTFIFSTQKTGRIIYIEDIDKFKPVFDMLMIDAPGRLGCVGELMPSYTRTQGKQFRMN